MGTNKDITLHTEKLTPSQIIKLCPNLVKFTSLTNRQKAFAWYFVKNGNDKLDATIKAGYTTSKEGKEKKKYLQIQGNQNINNPKIQEAIKVIVNDQINIKKLSIEHNIFERLLKIIELDICDYLEDDGTVKNKLSDIPKHIRQMIKKTEVKYYGKGAEVKVLTLEFLDKQWAIEKVMKYVNMIRDKETNINVISEDVKMNIMNVLMGKEPNQIKEVN